MPPRPVWAARQTGRAQVAGLGSKAWTLGPPRVGRARESGVAAGGAAGLGSALLPPRCVRGLHRRGPGFVHWLDVCVARQVRLEWRDRLRPVVIT